VRVCTLLGLQFGQTKNEDSAFRSKYVWGSMVCYPQLGGGEESRVYAKTLDRRPCTGRSQEAVVTFLFGLEALLTRDSRVLSRAVSSSPEL
jgi:hypothetical protein